MKKEKLFKFAFLIAAVAAILLAACFVNYLIILVSSWDEWTRLSGNSIQQIGSYQLIKCIIRTGIGFVFALRTMVVLRQSRLFDMLLGKLLLAVTALEFLAILPLGSYLALSLFNFEGVIAAMCTPCLMLLISIIYCVGAQLEKEDSLTI